MTKLEQLIHKATKTLPWTAILLLSAVGIAGAIVAGVKLPSDQYSPIATLVAAASSFLAVVWFTATLLYQARQLREQRNQFTVSLDRMHRDSKRDALVVAESILRDTEKRALGQNKDMKSLAEILPIYVDFSNMKVMIESKDPNEVLAAGMKWLQQEGPALTLMRGIKAAALMYQESVGTQMFIPAKEPDEFVYINGPVLWSLPFFQNYQGISDIVAQFMFTLLPGRTSAQLAYMVAIAKTNKEGIVKKEKLEEDIRLIREKNYPIPKIIEGF